MCRHLNPDVVTSVAETATKGKLALVTLDGNIVSHVIDLTRKIDHVPQMQLTL